MGLTLIATVSSALANAYVTRASCASFISMDIHKYSTWSSVSTANQESCIIMATSLLDTQISWIGDKKSTTQKLRWPRSFVDNLDGEAVLTTIIPEFLQIATSYYAFFLSQTNRTQDSETYGFKSLKAGSLAMVIDKYDRKPVMPSIVWEIVRPYGTRIAGIPRVLERR